MAQMIDRTLHERRFGRCLTTGNPAAAILTMTVLTTAGAPAIGGTATAAAQTVRGTLVEQSSGTRLPGGAVTLHDSLGTTVDTTRAAADGTFTLRATMAGLYSVFFVHPGYASVLSDTIRLATGQTVEHEFGVPLISAAAIRRMSEVINLEERLQGNLGELCGEPPRLWEAGILVGVVRQRAGEPLAGAMVVAETPGRDGERRFRRATVTSANGVYVICNVPAGHATLRTQITGYSVDEGAVELRAGNVSWYDIELRPSGGAGTTRR